jgi:sigma-B regulation protein RsbU (phosphoserine phosphatase)
MNESFLAGAEGLEYATAIVLGYYSGSGELLFTNAGHMPPLWYHAAEEKWTLLLESTPYAKQVADLPLGLIPGTPYSQTAVQLSLGDVLVLYTDGVTDSTDHSGAHLDQNGLLALARGVPSDSAAVTGRSLIEVLDLFRGVVPPNDDETIVVLQRVTAP